MKHSLRLLLIASAFIFQGCSLGDNDNSQDKAVLKQNKIIETLYGPLVGSYDCKITNTSNGSDEDAQLIIRITTSTITNPDGTPGTKKSPTATFHRIFANYTLVPTGYTPETGELSMNGTEYIESILGSVRGKVYTAAIQTKSQGKLGDLRCEWKTKDTRPGKTIRERVEEEFRAVEGLYKGEIIHPRGEKNPIPVTIRLSVQENSESLFLSGFYDRLDMGDNVGDLSLTVIYYPFEKPPEISMEGQGLLNYRINMFGTVEDHTIKVAVNTKRDGYIGELTATRIDLPDRPDQPPPDDLFEEYEKVQGQYEGRIRIRKADGSRERVTFKLVLSASRFRNRPILNAQLTRSDKGRSGGTVTTASYDPTASPPTFVLRADAGDGDLNIFEGTLIEHRKVTARLRSDSEGNIGTIELRKRR